MFAGDVKKELDSHFVIIHDENDDITLYPFKSKDEAGEFQDKIADVPNDAKVVYQKHNGVYYSVDKAFKEFKESYDIDDDNEDDDNEDESA